MEQLTFTRNGTIPMSLFELCFDVCSLRTCSSSQQWILKGEFLNCRQIIFINVLIVYS